MVIGELVVCLYQVQVAFSAVKVQKFTKKYASVYKYEQFLTILALPDAEIVIATSSKQKYEV